MRDRQANCQPLMQSGRYRALIACIECVREFNFVYICVCRSGAARGGGGRGLAKVILLMWARHRWICKSLRGSLRASGTESLTDNFDRQRRTIHPTAMCDNAVDFLDHVRGSSTSPPDSRLFRTDMLIISISSRIYMNLVADSGAPPRGAPQHRPVHPRITV